MKNSKEAILAAAKTIAQAHGYGGLNYRDLAEQVGIKAASIYHHFPSKADMAAAVARRYWEDAAAALETMWSDGADDAQSALNAYPETFRWALENGNRMCLCSFMAAEYDDLPQQVKVEVQRFADVNIEWLIRALIAAGKADPTTSEARARAVFASIVGAQLFARSRGDISLYDQAIESYRMQTLL